MIKFAISGPADYKFVVEAEDRTEAIAAFKKFKTEIEDQLQLQVHDIDCEEML